MFRITLTPSVQNHIKMITLSLPPWGNFSLKICINFACRELETSQQLYHLYPKCMHTAVKSPALRDHEVSKRTVYTSQYVSSPDDFTISFRMEALNSNIDTRQESQALSTLVAHSDLSLFSTSPTITLLSYK